MRKNKEKEKEKIENKSKNGKKKKKKQKRHTNKKKGNNPKWRKSKTNNLYGGTKRTKTIPWLMADPSFLIIKTKR